MRFELMLVPLSVLLFVLSETHNLSHITGWKLCQREGNSMRLHGCRSKT